MCFFVKLFFINKAKYFSLIYTKVIIDCIYIHYTLNID